MTTEEIFQQIDTATAEKIEKTVVQILQDIKCYQKTSNTDSLSDSIVLRLAMLMAQANTTKTPYTESFSKN